jgi:hypothetical protein
MEIKLSPPPPIPPPPPSNFPLQNKNPSGNTKINKKRDLSQHTIDKKHSQMLEKFTKNESEIIPKLKSQIRELENTLNNLAENATDRKMDIEDQIRAHKTHIKKLRNEKKHYFLENSKYIFNYFEEKKRISSGEKQNVNVLNSFFKIKTEENIEKISNLKHYITNYWKNVDNEITNIQDFIVPTDVCIYCRQGEFIPQDEEGILICNNKDCGRFVSYIVDGSKPSNKEPPNEVSYTAYIRLNHFKEILSQFQAKETTQIPEAVIENIRNRLKKERIKDYATELNYEKMREILRKLGYNKYFEHIQYINSIFGIRPPFMSDELHETLCVLFIEIQKPWAIHCPANRTNFFNYTYTLYQLCVLLGQSQFLPHIPLLKDQEKQREQDMIWKRVCDTLDWCYYPTV